MSLFEQKLEGVPQFVSYFIPAREPLQNPDNDTGLKDIERR